MPQWIELKLKNKFTEFAKLIRFLEKFREDHCLSPKAFLQITLSLEEIFNNVLLHGHNDQKEHEISFNFMLEGEKMMARVEDNAPPFNPLKVGSPDTTSSLEERPIGGLGIHFVRSMMDRVDYERKNGRNILMIEKNIKE